ncbi:hypothetical protein Taro_012091, partial [Colocasia esculenta]|nr:hypothetical protein [Colocasia esculenta]
MHWVTLAHGQPLLSREKIVARPKAHPLPPPPLPKPRHKGVGPICQHVSGAGKRSRGRVHRSDYMTKSKYEYVRDLERDDKLPNFNWVVVRIDGWHFH